MVTRLNEILAYGSPAVALDKLLLRPSEARRALCYMVSRGYMVWTEPVSIERHLYCYASVLSFPGLLDARELAQMEYRLWQVFAGQVDPDQHASWSREYQRVVQQADIRVTRFWLSS